MGEASGASGREADGRCSKEKERVILELIDLGLLDDFPSSPGDSRDINIAKDGFPAEKKTYEH